METFVQQLYGFWYKIPCCSVLGLPVTNNYFYYGLIIWSIQHQKTVQKKSKSSYGVLWFWNNKTPFVQTASWREKASESERESARERERERESAREASPPPPTPTREALSLCLGCLLSLSTRQDIMLSTCERKKEGWRREEGRRELWKSGTVSDEISKDKIAEPFDG